MIRNILNAMAYVYCLIGNIAGFIFLKAFMYFLILDGAFWNIGFTASVVGICVSLGRFLVRAICWPFGAVLVANTELTFKEWTFDYWEFPTEVYGNHERWTFVADMNMSGAVTISDLCEWVKWIFFYPGDYFIQFLINYFPNDAKFLEINSGDFSGFHSGIISTAVLGIILLPLVAIVRPAILFWFKANESRTDQE